VLVPLRVPVASRRQRAAAGLETVGPAAGLETVGPGGRAGDGRPRRPCWRRSAPAAVLETVGPGGRLRPVPGELSGGPE